MQHTSLSTLATSAEPAATALAQALGGAASPLAELAGGRSYPVFSVTSQELPI